MIEYERKALQGVPDYRAAELLPKRSEYCLLIPVINEGARILTELGRAQTAGVDTLCDIVICDGAGRDYKCRLVQTLEHEAEAEVIEVVPCKAEPTVRTTVFAGLPKGERSDFLVQKCTEAGAAEIVFFSCTRCVAKAVNMEKKLERWQRIAEEAAKQSGRGIIPQVRYEADFVAVLNGALHTDLPLFMYETGERETIRDANFFRLFSVPCWQETTTLSSLTGFPSSYSTVTCAFPSEKISLIYPLLLQAESSRVIRCARTVGIGISCGVSSHAYPTITP